MKKKLLRSAAIGALFLLCGHIAGAQGMAVNTTATAADASAILDVNSTTKGLLIPRMTLVDRGNITSPATGLLIYQTDATPGFYYNSGTPGSPVWTSMTQTPAGTIMPFSSGGSMWMTTIAGGLPGYGSNIAFGHHADLVDLTSPSIDATAMAEDHSFLMPRNGTITSMSAFFSTDAALSLVGTTVTVTAQLYVSTAPDNNFVPIPGALVTLSPGLTGILAPGTVVTGIATGLSIPVTAMSRCMLIYSVSASGISQINTVTGFGSAGINMQ